MAKNETEEVINILNVKTSNFGLFYKDNGNLMEDLSRRMIAYESQRFKEKLTGQLHEIQY